MGNCIISEEDHKSTLKTEISEKNMNYNNNIHLNSSNKYLQTSQNKKTLESTTQNEVEILLQRLNPETRKIYDSMKSFFIYNYDFPENEEKNLEFKDPIDLEIGAVYFGTWKNNERWGKGLQIWTDGSIFEGFWKNDKANGKGRLIHSDGDFYEGFFF